MNINSIISKVNVAIIAEFDVKESDLCSEAKLGDDLGLDSLDGIDLVIAIESEFKDYGLKVDEVSARQMETLGDIYDYIQSKLENDSERKEFSNSY